MAIKAKTVVHQHIVDNHPHLIHTIVDASLGHQKIVEDAKVTVALGKGEADRLAAEKAEAERVAKEAAEKAEAEEARLAKEAEDARLAKETEDARLAKEAEDARLAKEAEDARLAKEAADKAAADALAKAKCPVLDEADVKANTKFVLKSLYNGSKHNAVYDKTLKLQDAIKNSQDLTPLVDDFSTSNSKSFINTVSGFGTVVKPLWPDTIEKEGCLEATKNPTGNADYCKYKPAKGKMYDKDSVQTFVDTKLLSKTAQGVVKSLDDAKQNYCDAFNLFKAAPDGKDCLKLVVEGYCNTTDTVNAAAHDVLCNSFDWTQFDNTVC